MIFSPPRTVVFLMGMLCGAVALAAYLFHGPDVVFPKKWIFDDKDEAIGFVSVRGALPAEGIRPRNNMIQIWCYKSNMTCSAVSQEQVGNNQVSSISEPIVLPISEWDSSIIVATDSKRSISSYPWGCLKTTLYIQRIVRSAVWIEEPINPTSPLCTNTPTVIRKWTIEDPPSLPC
jgi:hypothetical protein